MGTLVTDAINEAVGSKNHFERSAEDVEAWRKMVAQSSITAKIDSFAIRRSQDSAAEWWALATTDTLNVYRETKKGLAFFFDGPLHGKLLAGPDGLESLYHGDRQYISFWVESKSLPKFVRVYIWSSSIVPRNDDAIAKAFDHAVVSLGKPAAIATETYTGMGNTGGRTTPVYVVDSCGCECDRTEFAIQWPRAADAEMWPLATHKTLEDYCRAFDNMAYFHDGPLHGKLLEGSTGRAYLYHQGHRYDRCWISNGTETCAPRTVCVYVWQDSPIPRHDLQLMRDLDKAVETLKSTTPQPTEGPAVSSGPRTPLQEVSMGSWLFQSLRALGALAVLLLAAVGAGSVFGFYALLFGMVTTEEFVAVVDTSRDWHLTMLGSIGGLASGVVARYSLPAAGNAILNELARRLGDMANPANATGTASRAAGQRGNR